MINASVRLGSTLARMAAFLVVGAGCAGKAARVDAAPSVETPTTAQSTMPQGFGESNTLFPCRPISTLWINCPSLSRRDFADTASYERLAQFLKKFDADGKWSSPTLPIERHVEDGQATARHALRVMGTSKDVQFRGSSAGSLVMARFDVYKLSGTDQRYGITPDPNGEDWQQFFMVVKLSEPEAHVVNEGYKFGTWSIYRIVKAAAGKKDVIEPVGKSGSYRWCAVPREHVAYEDGAQFVSCSTAHALQMIEQHKDIERMLRSKQTSLLTAVRQELGVAASVTATTSDVETALRKLLNLRNASADEFLRVVSIEQVGIIAQALRDARTAPAWMLCGSGSCIADESE